MHFWLVRIKLVSLCREEGLMQNTAGFDGCSSPAAEMKWKASCSRSKQLLLFTLDTHKGLSSLCLWINMVFVLPAPKHSVSYLLMAGEGGGCLIYQLYLDCTRITTAIRRCSVLDPSVLREQRVWISASSLQVSNLQLAAILLAAISGASS